MLSDFLFRIRSLLRRDAAELDLDDELAFHRDEQLGKYLKSGLTREEALRRIRIEFGAIDQVKEECREARGVRLLEELMKDVRYALRGLRKAPLFTAVGVVTLTLGIGATTTMFSVLYGVLLRPLPYQDAPRLIVLNETTPKVGNVSVSYPNFLDWRTQTLTFSQMAAVGDVSFNLGGIDPPENISGAAVSSSLLSMMGVRPLIGRDFKASEDSEGTAPVALLSYRFWQSHFGGERNAVGRSLSLDDRSFTIVGVLPPDFRLTGKTDVIEPIGVWATNEPEAHNRGNHGDMVAIGRMAKGATLAQARAEMEGIAARLAKAYPATNDQFGVVLRPIRDVFSGDVRPAILALFAAVIFVLLISCANVANLFLLRGAGRSREVALRMAVGASRVRIVRQLVTESFVLATIGGFWGVASGVAGLRGVARLLPRSLAQETIDLNGVVLLFVSAVIVFCTFLFGLAPALRATKPDVQSGLRDGSGGGERRKQARFGQALAAAEISLALVLLIGAGLTIKSLSRLLSVDPGFRPERLITMQMSLRISAYGADPDILNFWDRVLDGVRTLPGVEAAALGTVVPFTGDHSRTDITVENMELPTLGAFPHPDIHSVSPGYVSTLGLHLGRGRTFTDADNGKAPRVAMINSMLARRYFAKEDPIGKRFIFGHPSPKNPPRWFTIVGVVSDTKLYGLANPARLEAYVPFRQSVSGEMSLVVRSARDPRALISSIRAAISAVDKEQPVFGVATMQELIGGSVETPRTILILLGLFGALALVLAAVGVYGVISYSVAQRSHEIGIRMALGAHPRAVLTTILVRGAKIASAGALIGAIASLGLTRLMANLLFSVGANDPLTFAAAGILMMLVAMFACYIPARRALRVDPMVALRHE
ncbi:MAG TPA: ABC transporter permease [Bryobacteraceae bacterium]